MPRGDSNHRRKQKGKGDRSTGEEYPLIPVSIDDGEGGPSVRLLDLGKDVALSSIPGDGWCNFWRQDDWSATAYFYHESPGGLLPPIAAADLRTAGLVVDGDSLARMDT